MISCRHCGEPSTVGNKFCSQCGWSIDPTDLQSAEAKAAADVADGQRLFGENRITEAFATAQTVLISDPDNVPALALKGDCLERNGDIEGALQAYEQVVTLKPDSPLDRIRVAQLRRLAMAPADVVQDRPTRKYNLLAGIAAFVLLTSTGSALILVNKKEPVVNDQPKTESNFSSTPFVSPAPVPTQGRTGTNNQSGNTDATADSATSTDSEPDAALNAQRNNGSRRVNPNRGVPFGEARLPDPNGFKPVSPDVQLTPENGAKPTNPNQDPDPEPIKNGDPVAPDRTERPPVIDIRPSQGSGKPVGGSQARDDNVNEATALIRVARQYFLAGEYDKAAKAYERAIKLGASTASANHRLAQCYLNLRKRSEALVAYQRALSAYQRMIDDGVGDRRLVETYIEECRTAIKLLQ